MAKKYAIPSEYISPLDVVAIPPEERTDAQRQTLRSYYLEHHDAAYGRIQSQIQRTRQRLGELERQNPPTPVMMPIELGARSLQIHMRGNRFNLGDQVPRRFLQIIAGEGQTPIETKQSGRLELARWIASPSHPLTARVMVNRIWQGHFGTGLVATSDNFGKLGQRPSHPQLLDWLATRFVESGWSTKKIHRLILLSSTYQMQSSSPRVPKAGKGGLNPRSIDPANRLLWRFPKRRLEAEVLRDTMLAVGGGLDRSIGGGSDTILQLFEKGDVVDKTLGLSSAGNNYFGDAIYASRRRSVYLPVIRNQMAEMLAVFDAADASAVTARRNESTVPAQAMFLLNNSFVRKQSRQFAKMLLAQSATDPERVGTAFVKTLGRPPTDDEVALAIKFLEQYAAMRLQSGDSDSDFRTVVWQSYCQLLFCVNELMYVE